MGAPAGNTNRGTHGLRTGIGRLRHRTHTTHPDGTLTHQHIPPRSTHGISVQPVPSGNEYGIDPDRCPKRFVAGGIGFHTKRSCHVNID